MVMYYCNTHSFSLEVPLLFSPLNPGPIGVVFSSLLGTTVHFKILPSIRLLACGMRLILLLVHHLELPWFKLALKFVWSGLLSRSSQLPQTVQPKSLVLYHLLVMFATRTYDMDIPLSLNLGDALSALLRSVTRVRGSLTATVRFVTIK